MSCAFHPGRPPVTSCQSCRARLCASCDHRIKGIPYCQDCIVAGIGMLQAAATKPAQIPAAPRKHSVTIAFLFSLFPGLGAVYNGQNIKALLHFLLIAGSWTLADLFSGTLESVFTLLGLALYLFSIIDTTKSARQANRGVDLALEEERIRRTLQERTNLVGQGLILLGAMVVINTIAPATFNRFWPIVLIILGGWSLRWRGKGGSVLR